VIAPGGRARRATGRRAPGSGRRYPSDRTGRRRRAAPAEAIRSGRRTAGRGIRIRAALLGGRARAALLGGRARDALLGGRARDALLGGRVRTARRNRRAVGAVPDGGTGRWARRPERAGAGTSCRLPSGRFADVAGRSRSRPRPGADRGAAIVEFVFLGVLLLVPLMYLALAASAVQRNLYGVTQAAREAGRAYATGNAVNAPARAQYAARLALEDQGLPGADVVVRYAAVDVDCAAARTDPWPAIPGAEFAVCVTRPFTVPGVPGVLAGRPNTVTGRFIVHLDEYRDYGVAEQEP
jgi:hypothetical protein